MDKEEWDIIRDILIRLSQHTFLICSIIANLTGMYFAVLGYQLASIVMGLYGGIFAVSAWMVDA